MPPPTQQARIFNDFTAWTSAHGVPHIGSAQSKFLKVFWALIFLFSVCMFCFQMSLLVAKYSEFDVTVQTELKFKAREFPAVTICGLNPFIYDNVDADADLKSLTDTYSRWLYDRNTSEVDPENRWRLHGVMDLVEGQSKGSEALMYLGRQIQGNAATLEELSNSLYVENHDYSKGMMLSCSYDAEQCDTEGDFEDIFSPQYGRCFTFNPEQKRVSSRAGPLYGLRIQAITNQDSYLPMSEAIGVRVAVHENGNTSFVDAFGYNAASGFTTSIGVRYVYTERKDGDHGNCTHGIDGRTYYYKGAYNVEGCYRSCHQEQLIAALGCADPRYNKPDDVSYCDYDSYREKIDEFSRGNNGTACSCPQSCSESAYKVTVSTALWPSTSYTPPECYKSSSTTPPWLHGVDAEASDSMKLKLCKSWFQENTLLIEIYYERMNYQNLKESLAYDIVQLISDMGGQLGLWMGVSVITMIECLSLFVLLFTSCCKKRGNDEDVNSFDTMAMKNMDDSGLEG